MQASGFVLVGGKSSRMGRDKALLPGRSRYVVQDIAEAVKAATGSVTLIGDPTRYRELDYSCIPDRRPALGPQSGIEAALMSTASELNLVLACDMPAVDAGLLLALLEGARQSPAQCIATVDGRAQIHPLCAVYKHDALAIVQRRLDQGQLALMGLLDELETEFLPCHAVLNNLNTPDDWERWKSKEHQESQPFRRALT